MAFLDEFEPVTDAEYPCSTVTIITIFNFQPTVLLCQADANLLQELLQ
jgi:hypothetical protein